MDQSLPLRVVVTAVICCALLSVDDVTAGALTRQPCDSLINHVDSLIQAAQPLPADDLRLYLACLGVDRPPVTDDDEAMRQLLALQPNTGSVDDAPTAEPDGQSRSGRRVSGVVCATVECLGVRATLTFQPCSRLTQMQCTTLVNVLETIISTSSDIDDDAAPASLLDHIRQLDRKPRQNRANVDITRRKRRADMTGQAADNTSDGETGSVSQHGGNDNGNVMTSSRGTSGSGGVRMRRSTEQREIPFRLPERMTPETQAIVDKYVEWRQQNGYGRVTGRWG